MKNFMGKDGFQWFIGVVEDREDPKKLGRLKVRCLGYHTEDLGKLPTSDLPWAHVMNPITSATVSGVGQSPLGCVEGSWVVGFFTDGAAAQMPCIIGTLPGVPANLPVKAEKGSDGKYAGKGFQDYINAAYPREANTTDVNRLAVNEQIEVPDTEAVGGGNQVVEFAGGEQNTEQENLPGTTQYIAKHNRNSTNDTIKMAQFQADLQYQLGKRGFNSSSAKADITKAAADIKKNYHKIYKLKHNVLNARENILTGAANHIDTVIQKTVNTVKGESDIGTLLKDSILVNADGKLYTPGNLKDIIPANLSVDAIAANLSVDALAKGIEIGNLKDILPANLSVNAIAKSIQTDNLTNLSVDAIAAGIQTGTLKDILPANLNVDDIAKSIQNIKGIQTIKAFDIKNLSVKSLDSFASMLPIKIPGNLIKGDVVAGALKYFKSPLKTITKNPHLSSIMDAATLTKSIGTAQIDGIFEGLSGGSGLSSVIGSLGTIPADLDFGLTGGAWSEPPSPYAAVYPYNHVYESESGHIREYDDTAGAERIHERHKSGSSYEIGPDGTKVTRVKHDNYEIISNDDYLHVQGTRRQTVDEGVRIRCNANSTPGNNYNIEVGFGSSCNIEVNGGNINLTALGIGLGGDININATRNLNILVGGSMNIGVTGMIIEGSLSKTVTTGTHSSYAALHNINAGIINLNSPLPDIDAVQ